MTSILVYGIGCWLDIFSSDSVRPLTEGWWDCIPFSGFSLDDVAIDAGSD